MKKLGILLVLLLLFTGCSPSAEQTGPQTSVSPTDSSERFTYKEATELALKEELKKLGDIKPSLFERENTYEYQLFAHTTAEGLQATEMLAYDRTTKDGNYFIIHRYAVIQDEPGSESTHIVTENWYAVSKNGQEILKAYDETGENSEFPWHKE